MALPVLFGSVEIGAPPARFRIASLHFDATTEDRQAVTFALDGVGGPAELRWLRGEGWSLQREGEASHPLDARGHLRFLEPLS